MKTLIFTFLFLAGLAQAKVIVCMSTNPNDATYFDIYPTQDTTVKKTKVINYFDIFISDNINYVNNGEFEANINDDGTLTIDTSLDLSNFGCNYQGSQLKIDLKNLKSTITVSCDGLPATVVREDTLFCKYN